MGHQHLKSKYCQISYKPVSFSFFLSSYQVIHTVVSRYLSPVFFFFFFCYQFIQSITFRLQMKILYLKVDLSTIFFWSFKITEVIFDTNNITRFCVRNIVLIDLIHVMFYFFSLHINTLCKNITFLTACLASYRIKICIVSIYWFSRILDN